MEKDGSVTVKLRFNGESSVQEKLNLAPNNQTSFKRKSNGQMQRDQKRAAKYQQSNSIRDNNDNPEDDIETPRSNNSNICMPEPYSPVSMSQVIIHDTSTPHVSMVSDPLLMDNSSLAPLPTLAGTDDQDNVASDPTMTIVDEHVSECMKQSDKYAMDDSACSNVSDGPQSKSLSQISSDISSKLDKVIQMCDVIDNIKQMTDNLKNVKLKDTLKSSSKANSNVK